MGRKRKRVKASTTAAGKLAEGDSRPAAAPSSSSSAAAAGAGATAATEVSKPAISLAAFQQQVLLPGESTVKETIGVEDSTRSSSPEEDQDSPGILGIPWALPPHPSTDDDSDGDDDDDDDDGDDDDGREEEEKSSSSNDGRSISLSATMSPDPHNRWKQHPDRRRKLAAAVGGGGRSSSNGKGDGGRRGAGARGQVDRKIQAGGRRRAGGGAGRGGAANGKAHLASDEASDNDSPAGVDGYYGPGAHAPPPCTSFAPREGKVQRVVDKATAAADAPAALVIGLDPLEQLCFVGAALVRCGRGQADISGYTLLPAAWGPYVEAHSPRWMSLLVVRALDAEEYLDAGACDSSGRDDASAAAEGDDNFESEIEEAIDRIAEDFPVVVVFKSLLSGGPLAFMSAQADADALYFPEIESLAAATGRHQEQQSPERAAGRNGQEREDAARATSGGAVLAASAGTGDVPNSSHYEDAALSPALRLAAELHLPGMQVVVTDSAGLRPFTAPPDWTDAMDAVLSTPTPPTGGGGGPVLVCGAKGVGKSSLCRFLVNRTLGRHRNVAYMDCDLGQPEFTSPGQVSLHLLQTPVVGPPHANIRRPELAYFVGTTTSKPEPLLYSAAVRALAQRAGAGVMGAMGQQQQQQQQSATFFAGDPPPPPPLVVNTDGWVKGMGEDLLGAVIDAVRPRHIIQILGISTAKTFDLDLGRLPEGCQVHRVKAWSPPPAVVGGTPAPSRPSPQDQRVLRLVAYFLGQGQGRCGGGSDAVPEESDSGDRSAGAVVGGVAAVEGRETRTKTNSRRRRCTSTSSPVAGVGAPVEDAAVGTGKGVGSGGGGGGLISASMRGGKVYDQEHDVAALLASLRPRRVPWRAVQVRVMNGSVAPGLVLHAINGALVGLVAMPGRRPLDVGGGVRGTGGAGTELPVGEALVCLAETPLAPCVGLGIVRSIDVEKRVLLVLTPEPLEVLKGVNVLVMGSLQLPTVMLHDPNWCSHPYFSSEVVGGGVIKNRNNLLRRGV